MGVVYEAVHIVTGYTMAKVKLSVASFRYHSATGDDLDVFVITVSPMPCPKSFMDLEADPLLHALGWDRSGLHPIA